MDLNAIIKDCLEGRQGAWETLMNTYAKRVFNMAYQFCGSRQEAEDLTQEIFLKLYNSLSKFDFEKNFTAWLLTLTKNYLIDEYRRTKWEKTLRDEFDERVLPQTSLSGPEATLEQKETQALIWAGLNRLSSEMRMAVVLRDLQGRSYEEMAEILKLPLGTVKSRVNRARIALAEVLREQKGEPS
ncbi:MAG: RNA polymerase sigma factor [Candidatus Aminicenantales bacterium]